MICAVVQIFGADEADDGVHQQRIELPRDGIGARLERLLIDAVMRVGRSALPWPVSKYITFSPIVPRFKRARPRGLL